MTTSIGSPTRAELSETPTTTGPATAPAPLRLVLSTHPGHGSLDGAWWPRSRNLATELADLVDHFPTSAGRVIRAVYSPPDWLPVSRRVDIARGYIKVGSFPHDDTHVLALRLSTGEVLRLGGAWAPPPTGARGHEAGRVTDALRQPLLAPCRSWARSPWAERRR
jgi:hypothetical protein